MPVARPSVCRRRPRPRPLCPTQSCSEYARPLRCRELPRTRRHRSLGIPQPGDSPLPVCGSPPLTTTTAASQHRCHAGAGELACLGPGPGRPGCVSPCCVQCRRCSARDTSRGNMDQSREPTKAVHASVDRRQSSRCPPCSPASRWAVCLSRSADRARLLDWLLLCLTTRAEDGWKEGWGEWTGCRLALAPLPPFFQGCLRRHMLIPWPGLLTSRSWSDANTISVR